MKWPLLAMAVLLSGCASVAEIEKSPETMSVMSGKDPKDYADCLVGALAASRKPSTVEPLHDGYRVIVPQKLSSDPAAVIYIEKRSSGSTIKVHERISNMPLRPHDVQRAATKCISG
ncbi:MAG: hypothetical protein PW845_21885 [Pseudomonas sp.]|uniref:hypothetical protein n=1 Tax=Pseudomonas abieticivorans TaxID=2931382 RepID=UPI0020C000D0|nr:hypothetical protein [Pseudomonas sp. PIA16]MDE1167956.1 hypothetical protein [Pseudomonas sp.]